MPSATSTISGGSALGRMWRSRMSRGGAPMQCAASTNSAWRSRRNSARAMRAIGGQPNRPSSTMMVIRFRCGMRSSHVPTTTMPNRRTTARMTTNTGTTMKNSVKRISASSDEAAEIAGDAADDHADEGGDHHGAEPDRQRRRRAVDDAAGDVVAVAVGAEQLRPGRRRVGAEAEHGRLVVGIVGRQPRAGQRHRHHQPDQAHSPTTPVRLRSSRRHACRHRPGRRISMRVRRGPFRRSVQDG